MHQKNLLCIRNLTDYKTRLLLYLLIAVVQSLSCVRLLVTHELQHSRLSWPSLSPRVCPKLMSIESVMPVSQPSHPLSPPSPPSLNLSQHQDLYLFAIQGTLKSLLQHHSFKASVLQHSAFFMVQLSHLHMTSGKTIALTIQIFVGKVMSLLFNMLSRFVIAFLPRSKHLLIS